MDAKTLDQEISEFLARGGKIKVYRSHADRIAAMQIPKGKYFIPDAYYAELRRIKAVNRRLKHFRTKNLIATAPGGGIEPGKPGKPWPNPKKTAILRPAARHGG